MSFHLGVVLEVSGEQGYGVRLCGITDLLYHTISCPVHARYSIIRNSAIMETKMCLRLLDTPT